MTAPIAAANRINVPAVCRIPGRGTAFLVSRGLLLSSRRCVGTKAEAARLTAIFFETSKKETVTVKLLPNDFYFASITPAELDYCLVACETEGIYGVTPVTLPMVKSDWASVREGDTVMMIQHPKEASRTPAANMDLQEGDVPGEIKLFAEVLKRRELIYTIKTNGAYTAFGCPAFNDAGTLVGIQTQFGGNDILGDGNGSIESFFVPISTIVKHLFANGMLYRVQRELGLEFDEVWDTWSVPGDTTRIISILANFKQRDVARKGVEKLCEHTSNRDNIANVVACGGTKVIVDAMCQFQNEEEVVGQGLRSLWNVSFSEVDNRREILGCKGIEATLRAMAHFPDNETINQYAVVVLFNMSLSAETITESWCVNAIDAVCGAMTRFPEAEVLQKFSAGFFANVAQVGKPFAERVVRIGGIRHVVATLQRNSSTKNVYLIENCVKCVSAVVTYTNSTDLLIQQDDVQGSVNAIIEILDRFSDNATIAVHGNNALWNLGNQPVARIAILNNEKGLEVLRATSRAVASTLPVAYS